MNSEKKWIIIGLCLVFIAGLFVGVVVQRELLSRHGQREERRENFSKKEALDRLTKNLSLNSEQRSAVDRIFDKHKPEFVLLHKQDISNEAKIMEQMDKDILGVLDDKQKKKFETFIIERKKHHPRD